MRRREVHDALVDDGVLALISVAADLIDVGKRPGMAVPWRPVRVSKCGVDALTNCICSPARHLRRS